MLFRLLRPWMLMGVSGWYFFTTILKLLTSGDLRTLTSWPAFHETWFASFWAHIAPGVKANAEPRVLALLEGRVRDGRIYEEVVEQPVQGIVLEIGAGSGMWVDVFATIAERAKRSGSSGPSLSKIYGVEPNSQSAAALQQRVTEAGLKGTYEVVPVGIEHLNNPTAWGTRIEPGTVDCIVTVQCLCSIPDPEKNIRLLHNYLKKGGRWYVYEHVRAEHGVIVPYFQAFTDVFWKYMIGGCRLCRPTGQTLGEINPWEKNDLVQPPDESKYEMVPHVFGTLTK
ncbi:S-adenosyl-L-methionine-dependent methyltransferase [Dactylonectria estremocensis]|uniref:S-adenosyl-L-methionine-dependent methyltransferase n=1 Tax=Dactylonectria estremocensis TaxID=1079267 RepID=A0A9P9IKB8_9HYPO|nr:S-adenosyl-L-methionine-dependent methyltransferase [Dactylonectria estremocensis]